jgi:hypothetical protein
MSRRYAVLVAVPALLSALACSGIGDKLGDEAAEKLMEAGSGADVEVNTAGATTTGNASLPAGFPSDIPLFPGATVSFVATPQPGQFSIVFTTPATAAEVKAFYKDRLVGTFNLSHETDAPTPSLMLNSADYKRTVTLTFSGENPTQGILFTSQTP